MNYTIECKVKTFKLASYSEERVIDTVQTNLNNLEKILHFNKENDLGFLRISSDLVPFASHPIMTFNWQDYFKDQFSQLGKVIKSNGFRIAFHPGQFVLINSPKEELFIKSSQELTYHVDMIKLFGLDSDTKIQIHVGGVYGDKETAINRFIDRYHRLSSDIKRHLVIENDEKSFDLQDCLKIHKGTDVPIIFDNLHHDIKNNDEALLDALNLSSKTWKAKDGIPMVDYSTQQENAIVGKHCDTINENHFSDYMKTIKDKFDLDIMLEIKDKELSALKAQKIFTQRNSV